MSRLALSSSLLLLLSAACKHENTLSDPTEPSIELTRPAPAEWMGPGQAEVRGEWSGLNSINVNGTEATMTGSLVGDFDSTVDLGRGIQILTAAGTDPYGDTYYSKVHVLSGEYNGPRQAVEDAAIVRINEEGIAVILDAVENEVDSELIADVLVSDEPIYEGGFIDVGAAGSEDYLLGVELYVDGVGLSGLDLSGIPQEDELEFTATIYGLELQSVLAVLFTGNEFLNVGLEIDADRVEITGTLTMSAYQGELDIQLLDSNVDITGFFFDTDLIPSEIEGALLSGALEGIVESQVSGLLESQITGLMRDTLSAFDFSYSTTLLDREVDVVAEFGRASIDTAGIELAMDIDVDMPNTTQHPYTGVLTAPGNQPTPDANADVSMSIWDDMINKMLFEAWRSDLLVQDLSSSDGSLPAIALIPLHADSAELSVDGLLPPVVVQDDEGNIEAQLGEVQIVLDMEGSDLGSHLEAALAVNVDIDLEVVDNVLEVQLGEPVIDIAVRNSDWGASNEATSELLAEVLPLDLILSLIGDLTFPLPDLPGVTMNANAGRDGNGTHTAVRLSLRTAVQ